MRSTMQKRGVLFSLAAAPVFLLALNYELLGYLSVAMAVFISFILTNRQQRTSVLIILACLLLLNLTPINTSTELPHVISMGIPLVLVSFGVTFGSRYLLNRPLPFRLLSDQPVSRGTVLYPLGIFLLALLIFPWYFEINPEVPFHRPLTDPPTSASLHELFRGSNLVGIRDELFFINVVFVLLRRYFSFWEANLVQGCYFTAFLYELAFTGIGPAIIYPFALTQGYVYEQRESVGYVIIIHLLVDTALFLSIVSVQAPGRYSRFPFF